MTQRSARSVCVIAISITTVAASAYVGHRCGPILGFEGAGVGLFVGCCLAAAIVAFAAMSQD